MNLDPDRPIGPYLVKEGLVPDNCRNIEVLMPADGVMTLRYERFLDTDTLPALGRAFTAYAQALTPVITGTPADVITTPEQLTDRLARASGGETFVLATDLQYQPLIELTRPLTLRSVAPITRRADLDQLMPRLIGGFRSSAACGLYGLELRHTNPETDISVFTGPVLLMDGCRVLGDPQHGAKRGIAANGYDVSVLRSYIEDCFGPTPGNDTQAFAAWDGPGPFILDDCYFSGGSETVLFGGADPSDASRVPAHILIRSCTLTKRPEWQSQLISVKNVLEFKNARDVHVEDCDLSECWGGHGQDGYLLMLTPRNQDNRAPYCSVERVVLVNNRFRSAAGAIAMLGHDAPHTSGPLADVSITENTFTDLDPQKYTGSDRMILILDGPQKVTIDRNRFAGQHIGSQVYLGGSPKASNLVITNNAWPHSEYGVFGAESRVGGTLDTNNDAWHRFVESGALHGNVEV